MSVTLINKISLALLKAINTYLLLSLKHSKCLRKVRQLQNLTIKIFKKENSDAIMQL